MASVRQLARETGVSIATISRVLNGSPAVSAGVRKTVLKAANRNRYVPSVGVRSTNNIAFVYTGEWSLGSSFDMALLQGMSPGLSEQEYDLLILSAKRARRDHTTYTQNFISKGICGVILRTTISTRQVCTEIAAEGFPSVVVADELEDPRLICVDADASAATRQALEHLLALGHRRIGFTTNVIDDYDHRQRLTAYKQVLTEAGIPIDDRLIIQEPAYQQAGAQLLRQIMTMRNRPTALFIADPLTAVGLLQEARRSGVEIPRQLSVIGFDDSGVRFGTEPHMSAVCQDVEALGRTAFALLERLIRKDPPAKLVVTKPQCWLELHKSTAQLGNEKMALV